MMNQKHNNNFNINESKKYDIQEILLRYNIMQYKKYQYINGTILRDLELLHVGDADNECAVH